MDTKIDKIESDIMEWFYETVDVLFNVEGVIVDATEVRNILEDHLLGKKLYTG